MQHSPPERNISVAVATYNRAHLVKETLEHILRQTSPPFEIVVVDDGSTDGTQSIVENIDPRVRYKKIQNVGPGAALKTAIELCTGDWIAVCDDDDKWRQDHLARRIKLVETFPDVEFTFSNFSSFGPNARSNFNEFEQMPQSWWDGFGSPNHDDFQWLGKDLLAKFLDYNPVFPTAACFSRALYARCGGIDPQYSRLSCWDAHFTWRCVLHGTVACDRKITVETRKHSSNFSIQRSRGCLERTQMLDSVWREKWIPPTLEANIFSAIRSSLIEGAWSAWNEKNYSTFFQAFRQIPAKDLPRGLKLRAAFASLPGPLREWLRRSNTAPHNPSVNSSSLK